MPIASDDLHSSDDEFSCGHGAAVSLSAESCEVSLDAASAAAYRKPLETLSTDKTESDDDRDQYYCEKIDQSTAFLDAVAGGGNIPFPSSFSDTVTESLFDAAIAPMSAVSHGSPDDSGVYSKAVSNSLIASQSAVTGSLDTTTDAVKLLDDGSFGLNVLSAQNMRISDSGSPENKRQHSTVGETLLSLSTEVCIDADGQSTIADVRSSILSADTSSESNQTIVGTEDDGNPSERSLSVVATTVSAELVEHEVGQTEVNAGCLSAEQHLGLSQELSGTSDSDVEGDTVLKTVIAVRTKSVIHAGKCADMNAQPSEVDEELKQQLQYNRGSMQSTPVAIVDEVQEHSSLICLNADNSISECGTVEINANDQMADSLQVERAAASEVTSIAVHIADDRNPVDSSPAMDDQLSTLSTKLDRYMSERTSQADSQILDTWLPLTQMASVKIFWEEEDPRIDSSGRKSRSHTRSFTKANSSVPSPRSCSPEFADSHETRRHSSGTPGTSQPSLHTVGQVVDLGLELRGRETWRENDNVLDSQETLTSSMVDLKLRPSKKKLEFESLPPGSSQVVFLEPPDEYRDDPISAENVMNVISSGAVDLRAADILPPSDLNVQAKTDHLQRYLKSLAAMPGCDPVNGYILDTEGVSQDSKARLHDDRYNHMAVDGEDGTEILLCHEPSVSPLMPDLVHRFDDAENLAEDKYLEQQLQQYEVMKQRLMAEHRRSLELLLLEQERQMSLLQRQMMGRTSLGRRSDSTGTKAGARFPPMDTFNRESFIDETPQIHGESVVGLHQRNSSSNSDHRVAATSAVGKTSASSHKTRSPSDLAACSNYDHFTDSVLHRQSFINDVKIPSHYAVDIDPQKISKSDHSALVVGEVSLGHKTRSPAGVYYIDQPVVAPSSSTTHSDDTESEFAYESPAVLRRRTPVSSPRDVIISRTLLDQSYESPKLSTQATHLHSSALDHSAIHAPRPSRRYVDMLSEASL